jgi:LPS export ABC transporter protein LptC
MGTLTRAIPILISLERNPLITRGFLTLFILLFILQPGTISQAIPQEPEQTVAEFNLSGFSQQGGKAWEISGKSADIFSDQIKLNDFVGTLYGQERIVVTADRGDFNKAQNKVHLEDNVTITTESGTRLTTDYLDWDRNIAQVVTEAPVDIEKGDIVVSGIGIKGDTGLSNVDLKEDVRVEINDKQNRIVITCAGPLSINYADNIAIFKNDVFVDDGQSQMYADLMEVFFKVSQASDSTSFFANSMSRIKKIVARGNVKIVREGNTSFSDEAVYNADNKTIILTGRPKLIIHSAEGIDASSGN